MKKRSMAVVVRDGLVLIQRRYRRDQGMVYEFPGGSVDQNESGTKAAIRELWEETGIASIESIGVEPDRQQSFFWFSVSEIPLADFYEADLLFIRRYLGQYV